MAIYLNTTQISNAYIGTTAISKIYIGTEQIWPTFTPMGMNKSGSQSIASGTWTLLTGWVARSGYPDTVITTNGLQIPAGVTVALSAQTTHGTNSTGNACRIITSGGTVLATSVSANTATPTVSVSYTPVANTIVQLQVFANGLTATRNISAGSGTYLVAQ